MHLRSYLKALPHGSSKQLAQRAGLSPVYVSLIASDRKWPSREVWQRIVAATDGQVTPNDHLSGPTTELANGKD